MTRAERERLVGLGKIAEDLQGSRLMPEKQRIIAALALAERCSVSEATEALDAAVAEQLLRGGCCFSGSLAPWVTAASVKLRELRHRRSLGAHGNVIQLFPSGDQP